METFKARLARLSSLLLRDLRNISPAEADLGLDVLQKAHGHEGEREAHDVEERDGRECL